jgi:hypothetical protein
MTKAASYRNPTGGLAEEQSSMVANEPRHRHIDETHSMKTKCPSFGIGKHNDDNNNDDNNNNNNTLEAYFSSARQQGVCLDKNKQWFAKAIREDIAATKRTTWKQRSR